MTLPSLTVQRACQRLRQRVRFENASFDLPGMTSEEATKAIREETRLYMESWVVPLLNAIERGELRLLQKLIK